ncbi:MAG: sugar ABC transporter permease, partial [Treponema sp.]|nr:sugar ABC transporter permease [Treponema sp.]
MRIETDGSSLKRVTGTASCFMGLSHILYLKEYVKGAVFAAIEVIFIGLIPFFAHKIYDLITLGFPQPDVPVKLRSHSIFMLIDGILVLSILAIFV